MAKKKNISAVISLKDNFSAGLRGIKREQKSFQREVAQTRKAMESLNKKKMKARLDATQANKAFNSLKKNTKYIEAKKKLVQVVVAKDMALAKLNKIKSTMKSLGTAIAKPAVIAKDKATSIIKGIGGKLGAIAKGVAIPLTIAATGAGMALKGGMELEQQQISMRHFMGVGNKDKSAKQLDNMSNNYLKELRNNANATPFETGEVIAAGTRALQISKGSTKDAMGMVKLAEDMAALNPGKTVGDAMEAIADMNIGEMARLTEFGVKASSKDDPKAVQKKLQDMYSGGAGKLADSGSGLLSTITGKLKSNLADVGQSMLEPLKPVMTNVIGFVDQITPKMLEFGTKIGEGIGAGITWINDNLPTIQPIFTAFQTIVTTVAPIVGQALGALGPVFSGLLSVASVAMQGISSVVTTVAPVVSSIVGALSPIFSAVGSSLKSLGKIFDTVFKGIMGVVKKAADFVKPLIDGIGKAVSGISGAVSKGIGWVANKIGKNATGTKYWGGGLSIVGEHGPELVQMPSGSKVYTNTETNSMMKPSNTPSKSSQTPKIDNSVMIAKLADTIVVREDADIDRIANAIVMKIRQRNMAYGG